jgi:uncharacterized protein
VAHWAEAAIFAASVAAGLINSIAGGGTLVSFPVLVWCGRNPVLANATNAVALLPGSLAGALGFRREVAGSRRWIALLALPSLAGGGLGGILLLRTSSHAFSRLVPVLIFGATVLLASQEVVLRKMRSFAAAHHSAPEGTWLVGALLFQFCVGVYGGYFGAGIGILMLAALGLLGLTDIHQMNGLKNLLSICINGVASLYFALSGAVIWRDLLIMAIGSVSGGFLGAKLGRRLGRTFVRRFVIAIGLAMTVALAIWKR